MRKFSYFSYIFKMIRFLKYPSAQATETDLLPATEIQNLKCWDF